MLTHFNVPTTNVPSLSSSAMLVELSISCWSGKKLDKKASKDVELMNQAQSGAGSYTKRLLGDCPELEALQKFCANIRTGFHYSYTHPWSDNGPRLLMTSRYFDYHKNITEAAQEFEELKEKFLAVYGDARMQAQAKLGNMWSEKDYPSVGKLRKKFAFNVNYVPLPDAGDFRVDIGNEAVEQLREQYNEAYERQISGVMEDVWRRLYKTLEPISRMLADDKGNGKKPNMYRSVFDRAMEIAQLMEDCNITGDPQMQSAQRKLTHTFERVSFDAVKADSNLKAETKKSVDEIIASLPSLDM